ncbi:MAG TPA: glycosyltransferase family 39 protein [Steroidobacteraceae bacterium]|jgi:4-amino-4-deoxy-L-arabinose transferase-like glycosyltransferase|nr:glycosyltransferase family 39 protein [Steroidobacteraceae bacterium]
MIMLRKSWMLGAAALLFTFLWFALLAHRPLFDPDEGRYAEIPREMLSGGDWVIPHLNGLVYLEKPPLQYWLTALAFRCFGETEFAARLCTGLAGFLSLATVFFLGRNLWGFDAGVRAVLFTSASTLFVLLGHQLTLDMLLSFCLIAALGCFLMAQVRRMQWRGWMLCCWSAMAFAVLAKGLIGVLIPAATLSAYVIWQREWTMLRRLNLRWGLPVFGVIAAPWFVLAARANPQFLRFFFVREHFQRFLTTIEHRTEPWWFFAPVLVVGIMPWLPQAARALGSPFADRVPRGEFDAPLMLWIWCVFVFVFFSFSDSKLIPYILPVVPALALLCAGRASGDSRASLLTGSLLSLAACGGLLAYASGRWASPGTGQLLQLIRPMLFCTCALLALGALICAICILRGRPLAALAAISCAWFLGTGSILAAADTAQTLFSAKDIALTLRRQAAAFGPASVPMNAFSEIPIFAVQSYQQSLAFYLQRFVVLADYRDEFDFGLTEDPTRGIATLREFARRWRALDSGFAVMPPSTWDRLSALGVPMHVVARFPDRMLISRR